APADDGLSPIPILHLEAAGDSAEIRFAPLQPDGSMLIGVDDDRIRVQLSPLADDTFAATVNARCETVRIVQKDQAIFVHDPRRAHSMTAIPYLRYISTDAEISGELRAPMTGLVLKINVTVGSRVKAGDPTVVMESMKMELRIASEVDGIVTAVHFKPGDTVERNAVVAVVEPAPQ
uniref:biotin/lipoyl-containing protein n=1 Tax=Bradyrhizobium elkanii TaxID=29448 RepID=UPI0030B98E65